MAGHISPAILWLPDLQTHAADRVDVEEEEDPFSPFTTLGQPLGQFRLASRLQSGVVARVEALPLVIFRQGEPALGSLRIALEAGKDVMELLFWK